MDPNISDLPEYILRCSQLVLVGSSNRNAVLTLVDMNVARNEATTLMAGYGTERMCLLAPRPEPDVLAYLTEG